MVKFLKEIKDYIIIIVVVILIRTFLVTPAIVDGDSMNETLLDGNLVLINKLTYRINDINRFDIVVLDNDIYRVYIAILKDETLIDNLKDYYDSLGINYYLKAINVSSKTNNIIDNYESLLNNCDSSNYNMVLDSMLKEIDSNNL